MDLSQGGSQVEFLQFLGPLVKTCVKETIKEEMKYMINDLKEFFLENFQRETPEEKGERGEKRHREEDEEHEDQKSDIPKPKRRKLGPRASLSQVLNQFIEEKVQELGMTEDTISKQSEENCKNLILSLNENFPNVSDSELKGRVRQFFVNQVQKRRRTTYDTEEYHTYQSKRRKKLSNARKSSDSQRSFSEIEEKGLGRKDRSESVEAEIMEKKEKDEELEIQSEIPICLLPEEVPEDSNVEESKPKFLSVNEEVRLPIPSEEEKAIPKILVYFFLKMKK